MDPRLQAPGERQKLIDEGKNVILVTSAIHSNEVGRLHDAARARRPARARAQDREAKTILANTIIMLVPSQNPDGVDIVGDYYRSTLGTPLEGRDPPELYHKYAGHDDNRDWYAFTQVETRYTVDSLYTPWDPQIVNDIHQQGSNAGRIFIPPYMDPVEPNIDPILTAATNGLGMSIVWRMTNRGLHRHREQRVVRPVVAGAAVLALPPRRAPAHRDRERASRDADRHSVRPTRSRAAATTRKTVTWNFPSLWPGGHWTLRRHRSLSDRGELGAVPRSRAEPSRVARGLRRAGRSRARRAARVGHRHWPSAFVIPKTQPDTQALKRLIWTLQHGQVEIRESTAPVDGRREDVSGRQLRRVSRSSRSAATRRRCSSGSTIPISSSIPAARRKRPYDVTAHTLPLLFGVDVAHVMDAAPAAGAVLKEIPEPAYSSALTGKVTKRVAIFRQSDHRADRRRLDDLPLRYLQDPVLRRSRRKTWPPAHQRQVRRDRVPGGRDQRGWRRRSGRPRRCRRRRQNDRAVRSPRYVRKERRRRACLQRRVERDDRRTQASGQERARRRAAERLLCAGLDPLGVEIKRDQPIARNFTATVPAIWFENGPAFEITDPSTATAVATYPATGNPLLSGWLLGGSKLNGKAALVDVKHGKGHVVLYGFRPQYRGQSVSTYPLIWGAMME